MDTFFCFLTIAGSFYNAPIKKIQKIPDKFIPLILLFFGILFSVLTNSTFALQTVVQSVIQGILVTGAAVLGNQIPKQLKKEE